MLGWETQEQTRQINIQRKGKHMGYRSDVFLAMKEQSFKDMLASFESDKMCITILKGTNRYIQEGWVLLHWSDAKWHEGFPCVDAINNFLMLSTIDDSDYEYHILGEEDDDYEYRGSPGISPFNIRLTREIQFDAKKASFVY